jgi:hypothetical protein
MLSAKIESDKRMAVRLCNFFHGSDCAPRTYGEPRCFGSRIAAAPQRGVTALAGRADMVIPNPVPPVPRTDRSVPDTRTEAMRAIPPIPPKHDVPVCRYVACLEAPMADQISRVWPLVPFHGSWSSETDKRALAKNILTVAAVALSFLSEVGAVGEAAVELGGAAKALKKGLSITMHVDELKKALAEGDESQIARFSINLGGDLSKIPGLAVTQLAKGQQ